MDSIAINLLRGQSGAKFAVGATSVNIATEQIPCIGFSDKVNSFNLSFMYDI